MGPRKDFNKEFNIYFIGRGYNVQWLLLQKDSDVGISLVGIYESHYNLSILGRLCNVRNINRSGRWIGVTSRVISFKMCGERENIHKPVFALRVFGNEMNKKLPKRKGNPYISFLAMMCSISLTYFFHSDLLLNGYISGT